MSLSDTIRLNKFISDSGYCSRREADKLIENNRVQVNGKPPAVGTKVGPNDEVSIDGMVVYSSATNKSDRVYIVYNKPVGITCTTEQNVRGNIVDAVDHDQRVFPIGRLDKPSEGLILLTSDGDIVNKILRAENAHDKEYLVTVNKPLGPGFAEKMSAGIPILGTVTKPCKIAPAGRNAFRIILTQGLNRQIRRMCDYLGYDVVTLKRLRIMNIELGKLRPGQWRNLTKDELSELSDAIASSQNEANKPAKKTRTAAAAKNRSSRAPAGSPSSDTPRGKTATKSRHPKQANDSERGSSRGENKGKRGEQNGRRSGANKNDDSTRGANKHKPGNKKKNINKRAGKKPAHKSGRPKR